MEELSPVLAEAEGAGGPPTSCFSRVLMSDQLVKGQSDSKECPCPFSCGSRRRKSRQVIAKLFCDVRRE